MTERLRIESPGERCRLTLTVGADAGNDGDERLTYAVSYDGTPVIEPSALGLAFDEADPIDAVDVRETRRRTVDETWEPVWGATDTVRNHYRELTVKTVAADGTDRPLTLVVRAYDDGVAFRYRLPDDGGPAAFELVDERTEFRFAGPGTAWWIPSGTRFHEGIHRHGALADVEHSITPLTFETTSGVCGALHEADLVDYASMELRSDADDHRFESDLVALPDGTAVRGERPHASPWRTLTLGDSPGDLVESHLVENCNPPCALDDTDWIDTGTFVGIWWAIHKGELTFAPGPNCGATTERTKAYLDFAADHDVPYVLAEGWNVGWERWGDGEPPDLDFTDTHDDFDIDAVLDHAAERGVDFLAHNETFGEIESYEDQVEAAFEWYDDLGIPGVKTGYAGGIDGGHDHHDQRMVNHHRRVLRLAAEHGLTIDPHEYLKPTGETRTYPNLVSAEAVRGMEHNAWGTGNPPSHSITLPFTRMLGGPLDYTPGIFALRWDPSDSGTRVHTTLAHQLALFPMLLSGLQMAADTPDHYEGHPALPFVEAVPATWDETRVLHDAVGECASIARRNGDAWFVGTATDERERTVDVPLGVLDDGPYVARCYSDAPETDLAANPEAVDVHACLVDAETTIRAPMASGGGQALHVEPATDADADLPRYDPDRLPRRGID